MNIRRSATNQEQTVSWSVMAKRTGEIIAAGNYLTEKERAQYDQIERHYAERGAEVPIPAARYAFPPKEDMEQPPVQEAAMETPAEPRPLTQADIDAALQEWNGDTESKRRVEQYMLDHARDKEAAAFLRGEYGDNLPAFPITGNGIATDIPWTRVQRYLAKLVQENRFMPDALSEITETPHIVCSLRAGETAGIDASKIDFRDRSFWITQEVQRVSDLSLSVIPKNEIIRVFPKSVSGAKSSLILKVPKTEGSYRKQYLTTPLLLEIQERLEQIRTNKEALGAEYQDYGLLICQPNGKPIDPTALNKAFKRWQSQNNIQDQIEFQGLRKSGQMHKVRLSQNNYQLVAENSGQSPEVLMSNYNEALESEKRTLSLMVETSFYSQGDEKQNPPVEATPEIGAILNAIQQNPALYQQLLQTMLLGAVNARQDKVLSV